VTVNPTRDAPLRLRNDLKMSNPTSAPDRAVRACTCTWTENRCAPAYALRGGSKKSRPEAGTRELIRAGRYVRAVPSRLLITAGFITAAFLERAKATDADTELSGLKPLARMRHHARDQARPNEMARE